MGTRSSRCGSRHAAWAHLPLLSAVPCGPHVFTHSKNKKPLSLALSLSLFLLETDCQMAFVSSSKQWSAEACDASADHSPSRSTVLRIFAFFATSFLAFVRAALRDMP